MSTNSSWRAVMLGALATVSGDLMAQGQDQGMQEVTVTANRREQSIQDVAIAIQAFSAEQLESAGLQSSTEVAKLTPGVFISGSSAGQNSQFTVRGVTQNDFNDAIEGPVAVYIDETYVASSNGALFGLFDIERVEVLKGPQGTLFGRNATGGLVHFVPKKPTETADGFGELTLGDNGQTRFEAALGGSIGDRVKARLSVYHDEFDGYVDNLYPAGLPGVNPPAGPGCCEDLGGQETNAFRAQLQFDITEAWNIRLTTSYGKSEFGVSPYNSIPVVPVFDAMGGLINSILPPPGSADGLGYRAPPASRLAASVDFSDDVYFSKARNSAVHVNYKGDRFDFVSITDSKNFKKSIGVDVEASPLNFVNFGSDVDTDSFTQEFRFSGGGDSGTTWVAGLYFLDIDAVVDNGFMAPGASIFNTAVLMGPPTGSDLINAIDLETRSTSIFGQYERDIAPKWRFVIGGRLVKEEQDYSFRSNFRGNSNDYLTTEGPILAANIQPGFDDSRSDNLFAGKLQIEYRPNDDVMWFAGLNRGVKGGSYNAMLPDGTPPLTNAEIPYEPEELYTLEVGFKSTLVDGTVFFNGSAFVYDYKDYQAFTFRNVSGQVTNNDASNAGIEFDISARPTDRFSMSVGVSFFDAKVEDLAITPTLVRDVEPTFAPKTQVAAQFSYEWPTPGLGDGSITLGLNANYNADFWHNLRNFDADKLPSYTVVDARLNWKSGDERWSVTGFLSNAFDERYRNIGFNLATICGCNEESYGKPRWWGLTMRYNFTK